MLVIIFETFSLQCYGYFHVFSVVFAQCTQTDLVYLHVINLECKSFFVAYLIERKETFYGYLGFYFLVTRLEKLGAKTRTDKFVCIFIFLWLDLRTSTRTCFLKV